MSQFKFRLETLLKVRQTVRDQRRAELAEAYRAQDIVRQNEDELANEEAQSNEQIRRASQPGNLDVDTLMDAHRYEVVIAVQKQQLQMQREQLDEEIEKRHERLVDADRDVRVLEKLSERQKRQHDHNEYRREVNEMDEVAARVHQSGALRE